MAAATKRVKKLRCDACLTLTPKNELHPSRDELVCFGCLTKRVKVRRIVRPKKQWYVIAVLSGQERKARTRMKRESRRRETPWMIGRVLVPRQKVVEMLYSGERVTRNRKKYPGYLLAEIAYCAEADSLVRRTEGVMGFMPFYDLDLLKWDENGHKVEVDDRKVPPPSPLKPDEVKFLLIREKADRKRDGFRVESGLKAGDIVRIKDGAFAGSEGVVKAVDGDGTAHPIVKVEIKLMGFPVVKELEPFQVKAR